MCHFCLRSPHNSCVCCLFGLCCFISCLLGCTVFFIKYNVVCLTGWFFFCIMIFCLYCVVQLFVGCCCFHYIFIYETHFLRCFTVLFHSYVCLAGLGFYHVSLCLFDSTVLLPSLVCLSGLLCVENCYYCLRRPLNSCCFFVVVRTVLYHTGVSEFRLSW